ncbi:Peroxiredoxin-like 2A [Lamellibrachia satsuma]|nr:Peroxiredoxin-like 2A [Lamellibrachia satsuma]
METSPFLSQQPAGGVAKTCDTDVDDTAVHSTTACSTATSDTAPVDDTAVHDTAPIDAPVANDTAVLDTAPIDTSPVDDTAPLNKRKKCPRWLLWSLLVVTVILVALILAANLPTCLWMPAEAATLSYLAETTLENITSGEKFKASELWNQSGAVVEAKELSSLKTDLDACGVGLYAVVHETFDVPGYQTYFAGDVFYDSERRFYGPKERHMYISGLFRPTVWMAKSRADKNGIQGNMKGSGSLLGGLFVLGPGKQGILLEHRESEWGDRAKLEDIKKAVHKIQACSHIFSIGV